MGDPILGYFTPFVSKKGYNQIQEVVSKSSNKGFTDASWEAMMKQVGWVSGQAWCAYFVKLVYMQFFSFDRQWLSKNITGSAAGNMERVIALNKMGDKRYIAVLTDTPQVGDIGVQGVKGDGHTFIVTQVNSPTSVRTIEGNTNARGSREGDRVLELNRNVSVGKILKGSSRRFVGYIRRNFTEEELKNLSFDENQQTLVMGGTYNPLSPFGVKSK